jgi:hypothetical protein
MPDAGALLDIPVHFLLYSPYVVFRAIGPKGVMRMNAVVFEAQVKDNAISIPEQYQDQMPSSVMVTVIDRQSFWAAKRGR